MNSLNVFIEDLQEDFNNIREKVYSRVSVSECYQNYTILFDGEFYELRMNLLTLDFIAVSFIPNSIHSLIRREIIDSKVIEWKFQKEGRAFINYLKFYYESDYTSVEFRKFESPDFILYNDTLEGFEVIEAIDANEAILNKLLYYETGRDKTEKDYYSNLTRYLKQSENKFSVNNIFATMGVLSPAQGLSDSLEKLNIVFNCIKKKAKKYESYDDIVDKRNIIVFINEVGFSYQHDFNELSMMIGNDNFIASSCIDLIFVVNKSYNVMIEYSKYGEIRKIYHSYD